MSVSPSPGRVTERFQICVVSR